MKYYRMYAPFVQNPNGPPSRRRPSIPPFGPPFGSPGGPPYGRPDGPPFGRPDGPPFGPPSGPPSGPPFTPSPDGPPGPPPSYEPRDPGFSPYRVDPGSIRGCIRRYTFVWLDNRTSFWYYPTYVGRRSISGYRWFGFRWFYFGIDLDRIDSFLCF